MSHIPSTFAPLNEGWTLTAVNPEAAPEALRATLAAAFRPLCRERPRLTCSTPV